MSEVTAVPIRPIAKGSLVKLWFGLALLAFAAAGLAWWGTRAQQRMTTPSGLQYQVLQEGEGATITSADMVRLHYVGQVNGRVFDSSLSRGGQPLETGVAGLIPGFSEGLQLMKMGGRYRLWIPPSLGYATLGPIPPAAPFTATDTLVFDIQIVDVARGAAAAQQRQQMEQLRQMLQQQGAGEGGNSAAPATPPSEGAGNSAAGNSAN